MAAVAARCGDTALNAYKPIALPFAVASLGIASFAIMDAQMKGLSIALGAYNAMLWRVMVGCVLAGALFLWRGEQWPVRAAMRLHVLRGAIAAVMAVSFFWGIARVPLAEGIALSFIAPLITLYLAAVLLGETISPKAITASLLGVAGVLVIVGNRLGNSAYDDDALWGMAAILISAMFYAYNLILQRQQAQVATPVEVAFFQSLTVALLLGLLSPWFAVLPTSAYWPAISMSAGLAIFSLLLLTWAYARAEAQILVTVEYTAFIWAAILGWVWFDEQVTLATIIGALLIVVGCLVATRHRPDHVETTAL